MKKNILLILLLSTFILGPQFITPAKASTPRILLLNLGSPEAPGALQLLNMSFVMVDSTQFLTTDLNQFDVLFVGWDGSTFSSAPFVSLMTREADLANWVASGHGIVALAEPNVGHFGWLPLNVTIVDEGADSVVITNPSHPIMANLTDALLSNWLTSYHNYFTTWNPAYQTLAITPLHSLPITLAATLGSGRIAITGQDPDWHLFYQGRPGAAILLRNMINWAAGVSPGGRGEASLAVSPIVTTVTKGSSFSVSADITNVSNLYSFDVFVTFDPTLLTATAPSFTANALLTYCSKTPGCTGVSSSVALGTGFVEAKESLIGTVPGFGGNGTLFTIGFTAAKGSVGTSVIHIASSSSGTGNGIIATGTGQQIAHFSVDGVFTDDGPGLFVSIVPNIFTLNQGSTAVSRIGLYSLNNLTGTVALTLAGVPTGVTATLNQTSVPLGGTFASTMLKISVGSAAVAGTYSMTLTGSISLKSKTIISSASLQLMIPSAPPDFSIALSSLSINIPAGGSGSLNVTVASLNGFSAPVTLSLQGLPFFSNSSGPQPITTAFSINPVTPSVARIASSTLSLFVAQPVGPMTLPLTVTASSPGITHTSSFTLVVSTFVFEPFFSQVTLQPGQTVPIFLQAVSINNFAGTVNLGTVFVPGNITSTLSTPTVTLTPGSIAPFTLTLHASTLASPGTFETFVTGTSGGTIAVEPVLVQLTDFSVSLANADIVVPVAGSVSTGVFLASLNNFQGPVSLQVTGTPPGVSASITPSSPFLSAGKTSLAQLTIVATSLATAGTFGLTITAVSGPTIHIATLRVHVTDFSLTVSASSLTLKSTQSANITITVTSINGFSLPVNLTISGLPLGVTATITPSTVTPNGVANAILTLTVAKKPLLGTFPLVITATSGSLSHTTTITLTIAK